MEIQICTVEGAAQTNLNLKNDTQMLSFLLISMIELDHQMSAAKTLFNKMGLNT